MSSGFDYDSIAVPTTEDVAIAADPGPEPAPPAPETNGKPPRSRPQPRSTRGAQLPDAPVPPQNLDAEESVLGAMMLSPRAIADVHAELGDTGSAFYRESHSTIYRAALALHAAGTPVDAITLVDALERSDKLDDVGGRERLHELAVLVPATANAGHYARIVRDMSELRALIRIGGQIARLGWDRPGDTHELAAQAQALIAGLATPAAATRDHTWKPVDLLAADTSEPEQPTIGGLVYPGRRHLLSGEPESLKSWLALVLCADEIRAGRTVLYVDLETTARDTLARLRDLDLSDEQISRFVYLSPSEPIGGAGISADVEQILADRKPTLVVVDAFAGLAHLHAIDTHRAAEIEALFNTVIRTLNSSGAAILILDHVPKDKENRGKFAIGSERKVGVVDVHLRASTIQQFGRGRTGKAKIATEKDRPGYLPRPKAAELFLHSNEQSGRITWEIRIATSDDEEDGQTFRPTHLMESVSRYLGMLDGEVSRHTVETEVRGQAQALRSAITTLAREGYVREESGPRGAKLLTSIKPYREADDRS